VPLTAILHPASLSALRGATEQKAAAGAATAVHKEELTAQQWFKRGFAAVDIDEKLRSLSKAIEVVVEPAEALIPLTQNDVAATLAGAKALPVG
jgi:hypothetical protein